MDDLISRQDVIGAIDNAEKIYANNLPTMIYKHSLERAIMTIPAQPQQTGRWINDHCSECGQYVWYGDMRKYCPRCGARMEENNESD